MMKRTSLNLELASRPLRNRRLFVLFLILLVVLTGILTGVSANRYVSFGKKNDTIRGRIEEVERQRGQAQREEIKISDEIESESENSLLQIDFINSLIYRKSFSWISFLSDLENALPPRCYIVSMAPMPRGDAGMEVRIRVSSPSLEDLLSLYSRMVELGFENVLIRSEEQSDNGRLLAEVSFIYEKHI